MYAVVYWINDKEFVLGYLEAGFIKEFRTYEEAKRFAYSQVCQEIRMKCYKNMEKAEIEIAEKAFNNFQCRVTSELPLRLQMKIKNIRHNCQIIRENEMKEHAGENPYSAIACYKKSGGIEFISTIIGYGNSNNGGEATKFYSVVKSFPGVKNGWSTMNGPIIRDKCKRYPLYHKCYGHFPFFHYLCPTK